MNTLPNTIDRTAAGAFDVDAVRAEFPILDQRIHDRPLAYLDNAATAQAPRAVINALVEFHSRDRSNIHRGAHQLAERATIGHERARVRVRDFLGAGSPREIVFVRGTTEAINLVARSYGHAHLKPGDEILITQLEHHANIVPWQMLCRDRGTVLRVVPVDDEGRIVWDRFEEMLGSRTKLLAMTHVSNALGVIPPVEQMIKAAHDCGAKVLLDGAQAVPHLPVDVGELDVDFYAFSGHKLYGPMGIGVLFARRELLESMPPYEGGGGMIRTVQFDETTYDDPPHRFEAGTPNIAGAIGLAAAIEFVEHVGRRRILDHEADLAAYAADALRMVPGLRLLGDIEPKLGIFSFVLDGAHPHDVGTILDRHGIATRTGHHCAQPLMERLGVPATTRVSLGMYNTREEIDALLDGLGRVREVLG